jgi:hypothetical protein
MLLLLNAIIVVDVAVVVTALAAPLIVFLSYGSDIR